MKTLPAGTMKDNYDYDDVNVDIHYQFLRKMSNKILKESI